MKILQFLIIFCTLLSLSSPVQSDVIDGDFGLEDIDSQKKQPGPFRMEGEVDFIGKARINKKGFEHQKIGISTGYGAANMAFCYIEHAREAYAAGVAYDFSQLRWKENPYFDQKTFQQVSFLLRFFSNRLPDWIWRGELAVNVDADRWDFNEYVNYDVVLWGRRKYTDRINLHLGMIVQTGMKMDRLYPVIGFDYAINKLWQLNAVFPVNISLEYSYNKYLTGAVAMRFFDIRYRVNPHENLSKGLFSYRDSGVEFALLYKDDPTLEGNVHVGSTLGGLLRISNRNNKCPKHFKLDPALYVGGELVWSF